MPLRIISTFRYSIKRIEFEFIFFLNLKIIICIIFYYYFQTGHTALQRAAAEGHVPVIKTLLENGVSVDHQDEVVRF